MSRDLRPLFAPASVAIVGASSDPAKWGNQLARGALRGAARRAVYLVNRGGGEILGRRAHRSLAELPAPPELVVLALPASGFEEAVDASLEAGARAIVAISAGLGELGEEGLQRERAAVERVRAAGAVLLGPNCLGVFDAGAELALAWNDFPPGEVGLVAQSGNLALEIGRLAQDAALGFSRFASLGNQADLEAADVVEELSRHEPTRLIALYVEDFRDGRRFARIAREAGKPVVLLAAGSSRAAARAARSHTGALVSDAAAVEAACKAAGIVSVSTPSELVDVAQALLACPAPRGRRVAVVGDGGGHVVLAAGLATSSGLELPLLGASLRRGLAAHLPRTATTSNPVDLAGAGEQDLSSFVGVIGSLLASGEVDAVLLTGYFGGYADVSDELGRREVGVAGELARAAGESGRPLLVHTMYPDSETAAALRRGGVPAYREIESAVGALARLVERALAPVESRQIPAVPPPVAAPAVEAGYFGARALVASAGIPLAPAERAGTLEEARAAAGRLCYPVVLKALGPLHKSDAGGVVLGIGSEAELERAFAGLPVDAAGYAVERMAPLAEGVELIAGVRWDARFGPIVLVGVGGL